MAINNDRQKSAHTTTTCQTTKLPDTHPQPQTTTITARAPLVLALGPWRFAHTHSHTMHCGLAELLAEIAKVLSPKCHNNETVEQEGANSAPVKGMQNASLKSKITPEPGLGSLCIQRGNFFLSNRAVKTGFQSSDKTLHIEVKDQKYSNQKNKFSKIKDSVNLFF